MAAALDFVAQRAFGLDMLAVGFALGEAAAVEVHIHLHDLLGGELVTTVLAQQAHRVGAALAAVPHQLHVAFALVLKRLQLLRGRAALAGQAEMGAVRRVGDQRHDVVQERAARLDLAVDVQQVLVVDAGDHHRVDLRQDAGVAQHFQAQHLAFVQDARRFDPGPALVVVEDPRVDVLTDFRIDHVDGDRDVVDVQALQAVDIVRQRQTVGREAQLDVGGELGELFESLDRLLGAGREAVAWAGDADHGKLRDLGGDREDFADGLFGGQLLADDAGTAFVGAVILAVTVVALDVAGRSHRDMHAGVVVVSLFTVAGMVLDLLPHFGGHVRRAIG